MSKIVVIEADELNEIIRIAVSDALKQHLLAFEGGEEYMTRAETASYLRVSLPTLHSYINKGLLTAYKVGDKTLFKRVDVEKAAKPKRVDTYKHTNLLDKH